MTNNDVKNKLNENTYWKLTDKNYESQKGSSLVYLSYDNKMILLFIF